MELETSRCKLYIYNNSIGNNIPEYFSKFEINIFKTIILIKMDSILKEIIYEQNRELLSRIANDHYESDEEKQKFMKEFHKKNYAYVHVGKSSKNQEYERKIKRIML